MITASVDILKIAKLRYRTVLLLTLLMLAQSILDLLGLGLLIGFMTYSWLSMSSPIIEKTLQMLYFFNLEGKDYELIILISMFFILRVSIFTLNNYCLLHVSAKTGKKLRQRLLTSFYQRSYTTLKDYQLSDIQRNIYELVNGFVGQGVSSTLKLISDLIFIILAGSVIIYSIGLSFLLGLILLLTMILVIDRTLKTFQQKAGEGSAVASRDILEAIRDFYYSIKFAKCSANGNFFIKQIEEPSVNYAHFWRNSVFLNTLPRYILEFLVLMFCLVYIGITNSINSTTLEQSFVGLVIFLRLLPIGNSLSVSIAQLRNCTFLINEINSTLNLVESDKIPIENDQIKSICIKNLSISLKKRMLVRNLNVELVQGDIVSIIGETGAGKSTLMDVICGLRSPNIGQVTFYDAKDAICERPKIAFMDQECFLTKGPLLENIQLEKDTSITRENLELMTEIGLTHLLREKNTNINSGYLSGGEKQRLNFIRALFVKTNILAMDEPTASLDSDTSNKLRSLIQKIAAEGYIVLQVTHDKEMLDISSKIIHLKKGKTYVEDTRR